MPARIKIGALPTRRVTGTAWRASRRRRSEKDGATLFDVEIELDPRPRDVPLRAGYSANADLVIREKKDVLHDPRAA